MQEEINQQKQWDSAYANSREFFGREPSELATVALSWMRENLVQTVLELGCGQGRDTWYFAENGIMVTALDYSEESIYQMKRTAKMECQEGVVSAIVHDARERLPFEDETFDAVYSHMFFTMEFTEDDIQKMLDDCLRVLKPGGFHIFSVRNDHDPHYGKFEPQGEDMWKNPLGFVVRFFSEEKLRQLANGSILLWIREFVDGAPPFSRTLYEVVLQKPGLPVHS
ncbi:MAG: class I SAM-dependent methyltransferase [Methanomassiliicoccus sp.]|nr:class I SAM-dependent methyltransferase [Methanomassiliicoccus sp.]